jgi:hypothetical protein
VKSRPILRLLHFAFRGKTGIIPGEINFAGHSTSISFIKGALAKISGHFIVAARIERLLFLGIFGIAFAPKFMFRLGLITGLLVVFGLSAAN